MSVLTKIKVGTTTYDIRDTSKQEIMQYDTMPTASSSNIGKIIQYIGTTGTYTNGYFYKCVNNSDSYSWSVVDVQSGGSDAITNVLQNGTSVVTNKVASVTVPTKTSDLTNDSSFITNAVDNLTNYYDKDTIDGSLDDKQDVLVSGSNIKTINNTSILGSGNIEIGGGGTSDHASLTNLSYAASGHTGFQDTIADLTTIRSGAALGATSVQDVNYVHTDNNFTSTYKSNVDSNTSARHTHSNKSVLDGISSSSVNAWDNKQNALVSGTNIKTINGVSVLGSGDITIAGASLIGTVEGSYTLTATTDDTYTYTTTTLTYPTGFTSSNSVCIAIGCKFNTARDYAYGTTEDGLSILLNGSAPRAVYSTSTGASQFVLKVGNYSTSALTCYYKIVFLKIS